MKDVRDKLENFEISGFIKHLLYHYSEVILLNCIIYIRKSVRKI